MITFFIIFITIAFTCAIVYNERTIEYVENDTGVVYKYFSSVRRLEDDKILHILQSTKDASYISVSDEQLKNRFHKN